MPYCWLLIADTLRAHVQRPTAAAKANLAATTTNEVYEVPQKSAAASGSSAAMHAIPGGSAAASVSPYALPADAIAVSGGSGGGAGGGAGANNDYYEIPTGAGAGASANAGAGAGFGKPALGLDGNGDDLYEQPAAVSSGGDDDVYEQPAGMAFSASPSSSSFGVMDVAVKQCRSDEITAQDRRDFLAEAECMKPFKHRNVVQLIGAYGIPVVCARLVSIFPRFLALLFPASLFPASFFSCSFFSFSLPATSGHAA